MSLNKTHVENAALEWFLLGRLLRRGYEGQEGYGGQVGELGYTLGHGPEMAPGEAAAERDSFGQVALDGRLHREFRVVRFEFHPQSGP